MFAAVHLTVLASLFAVTLCAESTTSTASSLLTSVPSTISTSTAGHLTSSTEKTTTSTQQHETTTAHSAASPNSTSSSTPASASPQTPNRTEEAHTSQTPGTTANNQTSNHTVSQRVTHTPASQATNVTGVVINATTAALPHQWGKGDLAANPGLVAILVIFGITLVLVLVVAVVKCIQSPRSNFDRLEDVPMFCACKKILGCSGTWRSEGPCAGCGQGNVNEKSPFAQYSK